MEDDKKVLVTKTGRDREATGEVGGRPVFSGDGRVCERYEHEIDYRLWDIGSSKSL